MTTFEAAITELVQRAPELDPRAIASLVAELRAIGTPLAVSIARVAELVGERRIDAGIALPPLAMACATLAAGLRGELDDHALEAARFEIETLLPVPKPDVPLSRVRRRQT